MTLHDAFARFSPLSASRKIAILARNAATGLALTATLAFAGPAMAGEDEMAENFIADLAAQTLSTIGNPDMSEIEQQGVFRRLLVANTDLEKFGRSALGRYSRLPTEIEFAEYVDALEDHAVQVLASRFALFANHSISVDGSQVRESRKNRYVIVKTGLDDETGADVATIHWVLITKPIDGDEQDGDEQDGDRANPAEGEEATQEYSHRIFDIVVQTPGESGTFSMLKTQRDEFSQILRANSREMGALIAYLRGARAPASDTN